MKTPILNILLILLVSLGIHAQVVEKDVSMSEGVQNALAVELKGADKKKAEKIWKSFAKQYGKIETNRKEKELILRDAKIPAIDSDSTVTIYTKFEEFGDMTRTHIWIKRDGQFLNSIDHEKAIAGADIFFKDYMIQVEKDVVREELKTEEKALANLQKDLNKLEKRNKDLHKDIEKARDTIRKAEEEIEKNIQQQADKQSEIEDQKSRLSDVTEKINKIGKS